MTVSTEESRPERGGFLAQAHWAHGHVGLISGFRVGSTAWARAIRVPYAWETR